MSQTGGGTTCYLKNFNYRCITLGDMVESVIEFW